MDNGRRRPVAAGLIAAGLFIASLVAAPLPASAQSADQAERIRLLEERLNKAMSIIDTLATEVEQLKQEKVRSQAAANAAKAAGQAASTTTTSAAPVPQSDRLKEVEERLEDIEEEVSAVEEKVGSRAVVHAFDALELDLGGFLNVTATSVIGEDGTETSFNRQVFELLFKAKLHDDWSLFAAQAFLREGAPTFVDAGARREPDFFISTGTSTVLAWGNYRHSNAFNVQVGRFLTPHGIINIDHFPAILLDTEQPQFLRPFSGDTIFPNFSNGLQVHGKIFTGGGEDLLKYNGYVANFTSNPDHFNVGGRLDYTFGDSGFTLGGNLGYGERIAQNQYTLVGADLRYDKDAILWKTEVFVTGEESTENRYAFYTQPAWRFTDQWTTFYRFDYLDNGTETGRSIENAFGLTFKPVPNVHLRGIYTYKNFLSGGGFPSAEAHFLQGSATFSF